MLQYSYYSSVSTLIVWLPKLKLLLHACNTPQINAVKRKELYCYNYNNMANYNPMNIIINAYLLTVFIVMHMLCTVKLKSHFPRREIH